VKAAYATVLASLALTGCGGDDAAAPSPTPAPHAAAAGKLACTGTGSPVVVLESGLGVDPTTTWAAVAPAIARGTRVCIHQRPGVAGQPPPSGSRTAADVESELEALLGAAHIDRPVVVGASFGGYVAQLYAARRPVAGVVLVDSLHPDIDATFARLFGKKAAADRARQLANNPELISFADLVASAREVAGARFPDVPLVVLKHGISFDPGGDPVPRLERAWTTMQRELARLSPQGEMIVAARSHHRIAEDQPDVVIRAIQQVLSGTTRR
jgi:pimeloyl-ACP methyl ester carboxylesterase